MPKMTLTENGLLRALMLNSKKKCVKQWQIQFTLISVINARLNYFGKKIVLSGSSLFVSNPEFKSEVCRRVVFNELIHTIFKTNWAVSPSVNLCYPLKVTSRG